MPADELDARECLPTDVAGFTEWLRLTEEETQLANVRGYTCIKGRSGTGKTLIIVRRMMRVAGRAEVRGLPCCQAYVTRNTRLWKDVRSRFPRRLLVKSVRVQNERRHAFEFFAVHTLLALCEKIARGENNFWQTQLHKFEQTLPDAKSEERFLQHWCSVVSTATAVPRLTCTVEGVRSALASLADRVAFPWNGEDAADKKVSFGDFEVCVSNVLICPCAQMLKFHSLNHFKELVQ